MNQTLNILPIIVDSKGTYLTRGGETVIVLEVQDHSDDYEVTRFNVKGTRIWVREGKRDKHVYGIWHESGRALALDESDEDIVSKKTVEWQWYSFYLKPNSGLKATADKCVGRALANNGGFEVLDKVIPLDHVRNVEMIPDPFFKNSN